MCGGFHCSKNALAFLNIMYLVIALLLVVIGAYVKAAAVITSIAIAGGIIACGLFLCLIAILGLIAGSKHHQVLLFFYVVILFLLFVIQFAVSVACLALSKDQVSASIGKVWNDVDNSTRLDAQSHFKCCGWNSTDMLASATFCEKEKICQLKTNDTTGTVSNLCKSCIDVIPESASSGLEAAGGIGLFFSFTEMIGVWLAVRFRNQKDPSANPSQFL